MDQKKFLPTAPGTLTEIWHEQKAYQAFVPHTLPPENYRKSRRVDRAQSDADRAVGELAGLGRQIPNSDLFIMPFIKREAVLSSRIEGTQTGLLDLYSYEAGQLFLPGMGTPPPAADTKEVLNYVTALEYGLDRMNTLPISLRLLKELHHILMSGVRGERARPGDFRSVQNWIGGEGTRLEDARFVPLPPEDMMKALGDLEQYIHLDDENDFPALIRIGMIHYQFETIHPFIDGNGRIGRLLISLLLVNWGILPLPLLYLSAFFERHKQEYNDHLLRVSQEGDWDSWLYFFLQGVAEQANDANNRAKRLQDLDENWRQRLGKERTARALQLARYVLHQPVITIPRAAKALDCAYQRAQDSVQRLVDVDILRQLGESTYNKYFYSPEVLSIVTG